MYFSPISINTFLHWFALLISMFCATTITINAQPLSGEKTHFTRGDTLRGTLTADRNWFDVVHYNLHLSVFPDKRAIQGYNEIYFLVQKQHVTMQLDLFQNLNIDSVVFNNKILKVKRDFNAFFINFSDKLPLNSVQKLRVYYSGTPRVARNAPWDGGFVWSKDKNKNPWISVACQGIGASIWWPNKDHQSDEPDSMRISIAAPKNLVCASNGMPTDTLPEGEYTRWNWMVKNPINNYAVSFTLADLVHYADTFKQADASVLPINYYVLRYNLDKAKKHFAQVKPMLRCYEEKMGPYPFPEDGFALIETPFLGMEHQSGIAYGNNYKTGYAGMDYSGIGLQFDYIIIHEAGHEWWGNSITSADIADLWIHEGFCTYAEALYVECLHGYQTMLDYCNAGKNRVSNDIPIIGPYGVNHEGSGDMYTKGMLMLHTIRQVINNDQIWTQIIKGLLTDYRHKIVTTDTILQYMNAKSGLKLDLIFDQYLRYPNIPTLEYKVNPKGTSVKMRWVANVSNFNMPCGWYDANGKLHYIQPTTDWKTFIIPRTKPNQFKIAEDRFYINAVKK